MFCRREQKISVLPPLEIQKFTWIIGTPGSTARADTRIRCVQPCGTVRLLEHSALGIVSHCALVCSNWKAPNRNRQVLNDKFLLRICCYLHEKQEGKIKQLIIYITIYMNIQSAGVH
ncbi:d4.1 [Ichnoviriform fugitivi]|uniref:D4.1 n=1 Tax=Ichnoviriform fugitivi TaxID=265522 RepID=A2Q0K7_9VIRU|nr:d4.1 [Ichnoviriform fugitivi]BAF45722.1 d4.1 [Ichnoviriform fugitivi]